MAQQQHLRSENFPLPLMDRRLAGANLYMAPVGPLNPGVTGNPIYRPDLRWPARARRLWRLGRFLRLTPLGLGLGLLADALLAYQPVIPNPGIWQKRVGPCPGECPPYCAGPFYSINVGYTGCLVLQAWPLAQPGTYPSPAELVGVTDWSWGYQRLIAGLPRYKVIESYRRLLPGEPDFVPVRPKPILSPRWMPPVPMYRPLPNPFWTPYGPVAPAPYHPPVREAPPYYPPVEPKPIYDPVPRELDPWPHPWTPIWRPGPVRGPLPGLPEVPAPTIPGPAQPVEEIIFPIVFPQTPAPQRTDPKPELAPQPQPQPQRVRPSAPRPREQTRAREKERKVKAKVHGVFRVLKELAEETLEAFDLVDALYNALPLKLRPRRPLNPYEKAELLWKHFNEIDINRAVCNVINENIEDHIWGRYGALAGPRIGQLLNSPAGGQMLLDSRRVDHHREEVAEVDHPVQQLVDIFKLCKDAPVRQAPKRQRPRSRGKDLLRK